MNSTSLRVPLVLGHKGAALVFPMDPSTLFGARKRQFVGGTVNGVAFHGEIDRRRGVFYMCLAAKLMRAAKAKPGDDVEVELVAREPSAKDLAADTVLAWARPAKDAPIDAAAEALEIEKNGIPRGAAARKKKPRG
jgi:uncharacterized protein DUF1905